MDSFYGGKQGVSFVIKASFKSIDDMVDSFKKNDRFILRDFDLNEADKIVQDYFAECG